MASACQCLKLPPGNNPRSFTHPHRSWLASQNGEDSSAAHSPQEGQQVSVTNTNPLI